MTRRRKTTRLKPEYDERTLFEPPSPVRPRKRALPKRTPTQAIWTGNKAALIERYLYYFVLVTKHGTYIDGFAGPQSPDNPESWAAALVLNSEPRRLRHFHLCDKNPGQASRLRALQRQHPDRDIHIWAGDFNRSVARILDSGLIGPKEATFCLLDQRMFECDWETLEKIAGFRSEGYKIELFYFFPNWWFNRSLAAIRRDEVPRRWWGRDDWQKLRQMAPWSRARLVAERFQDELGYEYAEPWPIQEKPGGGRTMYFMVHATDHPAAPTLMGRAYEQACLPKEPISQLELELGYLMRKESGSRPKSARPGDAPPTSKSSRPTA